MTAIDNTNNSNNPNWVVLKFGGTSVSSAKNWHTIADQIVIDGEAKCIDLKIDADELEARRQRWVRPASNVSGGALAKYRATVLSASEGAVTVAPEWDVDGVNT